MTIFERIAPGAAAGALALAMATAGPAHAVAVDVEILFINDVSGSVTAQDFAFVIDGYADAFRDPALIQAIDDGAIGSIAVSLGFFSNTFAQTVGWTQISNAADGEAFATVVENTARPALGNSDFLVNAVDVSAGLFVGNGFEGTRHVIDVVTEGAAQDGGCSAFNPVCPALQAERDAALGGDVDAINALFLDDRDNFGNDPEDAIDAAAYGLTNLIGGVGSFSIVIEDFTEFSSAINNKLIREVRPPAPDGEIPLPGALPLMAAGLGGLALLRRRRRA